MSKHLTEVQFVADPETGKLYPLPAGGSDGFPPPEGGEGQSQEASEPTGQEAPETPETQEEEPDFSLAARYLEGIEDPEVLQRLDPYVRKWDAGVTRRFQELHSQLKPYQQLGDPDELSQAAQLFQVMSQDPERVYNALAQALGKEQAAQAAREQGTPDPQRQQGEQGQFDLPPEVQERLDKYEKVLNHLAEQHLNSQRQTQQEREDAELESYLQNLSTEFGKFDERFVLSQMMAGMSGEDAVKEYQKLIQDNAKAMNQAGTAPPVLSGGGSTAQSPIKPGELSSKDTQSLVANLMAQAAKESQ